MILVGNQRGHYRDMADHLLKAENEKVVIHQIRGFAGRDLHSALQESYAVSLGTKCKQHLYSLSLSPPKGADVSAEQFEQTIERAEKRLGLTGQPRVIVFHHKRGRDGEIRIHAHAVFCRVDAQNGRAIQMSYDHAKLEKLSHELFVENGWEVPKGFENKAGRDPLNYTHAEHQQAQRRGKYADDIKRVFQDAWERSDTAQTFAAALKEAGYVLARGDHAAFVAVDRHGEVYSVARSLPVNTKDIRTRFGDMDYLPSLEQAELQARDLSPALTEGFNQKTQPSPQPETAPDASPAARRIRRDPEHLLSMLTEKDAIFTRHKIAKALSTYIHDSQEYQNAYQRILASERLIELPPKTDHPKAQPRYSTREMVETETRLMRDARGMAASRGFGTSPNAVSKAVGKSTKQLHETAGVDLSTEQRAAIHHVTGDAQLSCVIGAAGAGKSTILSAARQAWEVSGRRVFGAALAGKAAKGLEQSSGIQSRTLASLELSWQNGINPLQPGDVLVIDEAGMIGSNQMARFISEAKDKGAKLVLVGDPEQLQPIEAGAPFRKITQNIQPATLHDVHRQTNDWQKQASKDFALGQTNQALNAYRENGRVEFSNDKDDALNLLVRDYLNDHWSNDERVSQIALAHRKKDVRAINESIRQTRKEAGELQDGISIKTAHGEREFASGDRLLFTRNNRDVGVQNGMLGTVLEAGNNSLTIALDDRRGNERLNTLTISLDNYFDIEHGYATTIHKSQGATVDRSYVLASHTMDRHLTYVAMTRHRQQSKLYASGEEFSSFTHLGNKLSRARPKQSTHDFMQSESLDHSPKGRMKRAEEFMRKSNSDDHTLDQGLRARDLPPEI